MLTPSVILGPLNCRSWNSPQSLQLLQQPMPLPQRPHRRHRPALQHPRRPRRRQRPSTSARTAASLPRPTPRSWPRTWASTWPTLAAVAPMAVSLLRMWRLPKTEVKRFPKYLSIEQDDILQHFTGVSTHCKDPTPHAKFKECYVGLTMCQAFMSLHMPALLTSLCPQQGTSLT